jgi:GH18 family chitinase
MANRLDWEYPVASDRGGVPADYSNLILLVSDIRRAFDSYNPGWQLTLTLPARYWYLKNFDIKRLKKHVN